MDESPDYQSVLRYLAPCGVDCDRCTWYADGRVRREAAQLRLDLKGFESLAARVAGEHPVLAGYPEFQGVLDFLAEGSCTGCRASGSGLPFCAARICFREKGVDYCFQCDEYPCSHNQYPEMLERRWRAANDRMKEVGVVSFYQESLERPRY
ncbi:MAG TPA: DUF3795 domain-containing protein [Thermoleophilia bacterium]